MPTQPGDKGSGKQSASTAKALVGLTGGIASGKSTAAQAFAALGVAVVNADELAREAVQRNSPGLRDIVAHFGPEYLTEDGELDREKMGARVFADTDARQALNRITHPRVAALAAERFSALNATPTPYVLYDVPLLIETGLHKLVSAVVVVATPVEQQIERMLRRDGLARADAEARIAAQFPLPRKVEVADFVIHNEGTLPALHAQVADVHRKLLARA